MDLIEARLDSDFYQIRYPVIQKLLKNEIDINSINARYTSRYPILSKQQGNNPKNIRYLLNYPDTNLTKSLCSLDQIIYELRAQSASIVNHYEFLVNAIGNSIALVSWLPELVITQDSSLLIAACISWLIRTRPLMRNVQQISLIDCLVELHLHLDNIKFMHYLVSRMAFLWIHEGEVDYLSMKHLTFLEYTNDSTMEITQAVLVLTSLILLDSPEDNRVLTLFTSSVKYLVDSKNCFFLMGLLPCLVGIDCLESKELKAQYQDILRMIDDQIKENTTEITNSSTIKEIYNPVYRVILATINSPFLMKTHLLDTITAVPALKTLLFAAQVVYHKSEEAYEALRHFNDQILTFRKSDLLTILSFYRWLLAKNMYQHYILTVCVPKLVSIKDVFITTASLKLIFSYLNSPDTFLEMVGLDAIVEIWKYQSRVWNHILIFISKWANKFKASRLTHNGTSPQQIELEEQLEIKVMNHIKSNGQDLIPIIAQLLKCSVDHEFGYTRELGMSSTANLLDAFNICIDVGVTTPQSAWNIILKKYVCSLKPSSFPIIYAKLACFYGIVGSRSSVSDLDQSFSKLILSEYLVPLLDQHVEDVLHATYVALTKFPWDDVEEYLASPVNLIRQFDSYPQVYQVFVQTRIEEECLNMSRSVFKGLSLEPGAKNTATKTLNKVDAIRDISIGLYRHFETGVLCKNGIACILPLPDMDGLSSGDQFDQLISHLLSNLNIVDSYLLIPDCIDAWRRFWNTASNYHLDDTQLIQRMINSLYSRLDASKTSSLSSILYLAMTGLVSAAMKLQNVPSSAFLSKYIQRLNGCLEDNVQSIEVKSAIVFSLVELGYGTNCFILCLDPHSSFAYGYSACYYLSTLDIDMEDTKRKMGMFLDCFYLNSRWATLGAAVGFSLLMKDHKELIMKTVGGIELADIIGSASSCLKINDLREINSSVWILSCSSNYENHDLATSSLISVALKNAMVNTSSKTSSDLTHIVKAQIRSELIGSDDENILDRLLAKSIEYIESSDTSTCCAGIESIRMIIRNDHSFSNHINSVTLTQPKLLQTILYMVELICKRDLNPKIHRALGWSIALCISKYHDCAQGVKFTTCKQNDPLDYRRLNPEKSYLKASFDSLKIAIANHQELSIKNFIELFFSITTTIPPVDWAFLVDYMSTIKSESTMIKLFTFASKQACIRSSQMLIDLFMQLFINLSNSLSNTCIAQCLMSETGLGKLLELCGFGGDSLVPSNRMPPLLAPVFDFIRTPRKDDIGVLGSTVIHSIMSNTTVWDKDTHKIISNIILDSYKNSSSRIFSNFDANSTKILSRCLTGDYADRLRAEFSCDNHERDIWAYSAILETRPELTLQFLEFYSSIKQEKSYMIFVLVQFFRDAKFGIEDKLKWIVHLIDLTQLSIQTSLINFYWSSVLLCPIFYLQDNIQSVNMKHDEIDWECIRANSTCYLHRLLNQSKSKSIPTLRSRLESLKSNCGILDGDISSILM